MTSPDLHPLTKYLSTSERASYPGYYELHDGYTGKICEYALAPLNKLYCYKHASNSALYTILALAILGIPALLGVAVNSIIHRVKAEKIKKEDYDLEFNEWLKKDYAIHSERTVKKFIDFCIANKIKAAECPHELITDLEFQAGNPLYIFELDGSPAAGRLNESNPQKTLVLWVPRTPHDEKNVNNFMLEKLGKANFQNKYPSSLELRNFYKAFYSDTITVTSGVIDKCSFAVFAPWQSRDNETISHIRAAVKGDF